MSEAVYLGTVSAVTEAGAADSATTGDAVTADNAVSADGTPAADSAALDAHVVCRARIEQRNKFFVSDTIEIMKPNGENIPARVLAMYDEDGNAMESCPHPKQLIDVELSAVAAVGDILRMEKITS